MTGFVFSLFQMDTQSLLLFLYNVYIPLPHAQSTQKLLIFMSLPSHASAKPSCILSCFLLCFCLNEVPAACSSPNRAVYIHQLCF